MAERTWQRARGEARESLVDGECIWRVNERMAGKFVERHGRLTWLRTGSLPRPDPRDFQDIRHTSHKRVAKHEVNQLEPSPSSTSSSLSSFLRRCSTFSFAQLSYAYFPKLFYVFHASLNSNQAREYADRNRNSPVTSVVANRPTNGASMTRVGDSSETKPRVLVRLVCSLGDFEEPGRRVVPLETESSKHRRKLWF